MGLTFYQRKMAAQEVLGLRPDNKDCIDRFKEKQNIEVYNCSRWLKLRTRMMQVMPVCCDPFKSHVGKTILAKEVHHIVPIKVNEALAYVAENLIPLCPSCHKQADQLDARDPARQRSLLGSIRRGASFVSSHVSGGIE